MLWAMSGALEISGTPGDLFDDDIVMRVRGAGPDAALAWRARYRDDDDRVWRSAAARSEDLATRWVPAKDGTGAIAALRSLRPVSIELRAEAADGRCAARTLTRPFAGEGVCTRRWRDGGLAATLHVPAGADACATVVIDATAGVTQAVVAALAAPLLASRGVLVLAVGPVRGRARAAGPLELACERLVALPGASGEVVVLPALDPFEDGACGAGPGAPADANDRAGPGAPAGGAVVLPPGVGARDPQQAAAARVVAWDALLLRLGARPRERAAP